ncbi:M56 family metallopeptidase [Neolewinella persica]|uniref:M56 family metallopeptidase n=1 Tax=Neolewinella persica TaxID=70998 RepID=UPI0003623575|nr:M56 family metallopeptidase [Neolewinella persica]
MELTTTLLPFATAFGLALLHSLWIGAVLFVGVKALFPLLSSPAARHNVSYGALLVLTATFGLTFYFVYDPEPLCENLLAGGQSLSGLQLLASAQEAGIGWSEWLQRGVPSIAPWLSVVYLAGLIPAIFFLIRDQDRVMQMKHEGLSALPISWAARLGNELNRHAATRRVRCYLSDRVGEVMTLGFWSPVIVFPVALVNELTPEMAHTILLHEIAHLRNYDHWLNYPQQFIRAFFFYHPAVHALCRLIDQEREHRCDDWVAARCEDRRTYASALVTVARSSHIPPNNLVMSATKTPFSQRIQRLFLGEDNQTDRNFAFSMLLVVLLGAAHLSYTNWGEDAGAANCLEEQEMESAELTAQLPLLLLHQSANAHIEYRLSKLNPSGNYRWMVTERPETALGTPCPTRKTVDQFPYIAAPEPPESSNPRAREQYERAQRKYEAIQERTKPALWMDDQTFTQIVPEIPELTFPKPLQLGISERASIQFAPCPSNLRKQEVKSTINIAQDHKTKVKTPRPEQKAPVTKKRLTSANRESNTAQPSGLMEVSETQNHIAYFVDGKRVEANCTKAMSLRLIESVDVIKGDAEMVMMGLEGYEGTIMVTTKKEGLVEIESAPFSVSSPDEDLKAMEDSYSVNFNEGEIEESMEVQPCPWL